MRMRRYTHGDPQIARRPAAGRRLSLAAQSDRLSFFDARWNLHADRIGLAARSHQPQTHLAAHDGRAKRHLYFVPHVRSRLAWRAATPPPRHRPAAKFITSATSRELPQQVLQLGRQAAFSAASELKSASTKVKSRRNLSRPLRPTALCCLLKTGPKLVVHLPFLIVA